MTDTFWCKKCLMINHRPNLTFDDKGVCSACNWSEEKKIINWQERQDFFKKLLKKNNNRVIVPFSGGKDSIYVAYKMKELGAQPLLVTVLPHMETEIGKWNRLNICKDFERIEITLGEEKYRNMAIECFKENGKVKHPWEVAISSVVIRQAIQEGYGLVVYGEEGGMEYGGTQSQKDKWKLPVNKEYLVGNYYLNKMTYDLPDDEDFDKVFFTQWSRFEDWRPSTHANYAILKGMRTIPVRSVGTFTCHSQISDKLQDLHMYILFVKFGFGRATADASIGIRDGWIRRDEEGIEWVEVYDGEFPNVYLEEYLNYLKMTKLEFDQTISKHANTEIMEHAGVDGSPAGHIWYLKNWLCKKRRVGTASEYTSPERYD